MDCFIIALLWLQPLIFKTFFGEVVPKLKTKKAAAKRFRLGPSGQIKRDHANHEHLATKKAKGEKESIEEIDSGCSCR